MVNYKSPKCSACEFGKGYRRPNKGNAIKKNHMKEKEFNTYHLLDGHMVYTDHYISPATGRFYHKKGKLYPSGMYSGRCVLIDHASGYTIIKHQVAIDSTENVKAKITFEREDKSQGVMINL